MIHYPESVISQHLHVNMVLFSDSYAIKSTDNSLRFLILRSNASRSQQRITTWLTELSPGEQKVKFKTAGGLRAAKATHHNHLNLLNSRWPDSEAALLVSNLNGKPLPCWSRACLRQQRLILCFQVSRHCRVWWLPGTGNAGGSPGWAMAGPCSQDYNPTRMF